MIVVVRFKPQSYVRDRMVYITIVMSVKIPSHKCQVLLTLSGTQVYKAFKRHL